MQLSYIDIALKLALGLISLVAVINISGKGNLAPTSASDQVQNYVLGGILGGVIYSPSISILQYFNILLIWVILVLIVKWLKTNNAMFRKVMDGEPTTLIKDGVLDVENSRKNGLSAHDVAFKLRSQNVYSLKEIKRAVLEQDGNLMIIKYGEEKPKYPVVADGNIQPMTLESMDKSEEWLLEKLKEQGYEDVSNIFLAEYDSGEITVITY